jgi:type VI protein secretion system component VasK
MFRRALLRILGGTVLIVVLARVGGQLLQAGQFELGIALMLAALAIALATAAVGATYAWRMWRVERGS